MKGSGAKQEPFIIRNPTFLKKVKQHQPPDIPLFRDEILDPLTSAIVFMNDHLRELAH
jgi:hypothetical protein